MSLGLPPVWILHVPVSEKLYCHLHAHKWTYRERDMHLYTHHISFFYRLTHYDTSLFFHSSILFSIGLVCSQLPVALKILQNPSHLTLLPWCKNYRQVGWMKLLGFKLNHSRFYFPAPNLLTYVHVPIRCSFVGVWQWDVIICITLCKWIWKTEVMLLLCSQCSQSVTFSYPTNNNSNSFGWLYRRVSPISSVMRVTMNFQTYQLSFLCQFHFPKIPEHGAHLKKLAKLLLSLFSLTVMHLQRLLPLVQACRVASPDPPTVYDLLWDTKMEM